MNGNASMNGNGNGQSNVHSNGDASTPPRRIYLLTFPRTASNLFTKILNLDQQPDILQSTRKGYYFIDNAMFRIAGSGTSGVHPRDWTEEQRSKLMQTYQEATDNLKKDVDLAAQQGKHIFVKEHAPFLAEPIAETKKWHGEFSITEEPWTVNVEEVTGKMTHSQNNPTIFPDEFLKTWLPTFQIRHPALAIPSMYRAYTDLGFYSAELANEESKERALQMHCYWSRVLYDWFIDQYKSAGYPQNDNTWPIIIDADDIIEDPQVVIRYAKMVGLDPEKLVFSWNPVTEEEKANQPQHVKRFLSTVSASSGVQKDKLAANLSVDDEARKWKEEFGQDVGEKLERIVRDAMPHYEYMKERRLGVSQ